MWVAAKRITPDKDGQAAKAAGEPARRPVLEIVGARAEAGTVGDDILLGRVAAGDTSAFTALMQRHLSAVLATARRIMRDDGEAEDIAQEAFLRLWHKAENLDASAHGIGAWLRRVASNLAIDGLRKARRLDVTDDVPEPVEEAGQLHALEAVEIAQRVEQALASLPPRQRIAVSLFHFEDMSQREVAALMESSEDALESLLARGRRRLKEILKEDWQDLLIQSTGGT